MGNIWHPVSELKTLLAKCLTLVGMVSDLSTQCLHGRDYYIEEKIDRIDRQWESIKEMLRRT